MGIANVAVTRDLIAETIFDGAESPVTIVNAWFDPHLKTVNFTIAGACVPENAGEVVAEVTEVRRIVRFAPR